MPHPKATAQILDKFKRSWSTIKSHSLFVGLIIFLPLLLFWRWVLKGEVLFWGTLLFQFWPWHYLTKTMALAGEWPLWNPLLGNGTPLIANLQTAFFYPLNVFYFLVPIAHGLTLSIMLHLTLAGLLMFWYARSIGLSAFAATVSGLTFMFSGYIIGRTQFITMVNAAAWFPLLLLLAERLVTRRTGSQVVWLGLVLAIQLLAGHAQLWYYGLWLIGAYTLFRSWQEARHQPAASSRWTAMLRAGLQFGLAVGLAILLAAVQVLPTAEFMTESSRDTGVAKDLAFIYSFWPWRLITLLAPNFFGNPAQSNYWGYANYWEDHAYIGVLPFLLALTAIWRHLKSRMRKHASHPAPPPPSFEKVVPFFVALIPISLILAMGWNTPLYLWLFKVGPGFAYFQAPARLLIWYTIAATVLAGIGAQTFYLTPKSKRTWRRVLIACVGLTIAGLTSGLFLTGRSLTFLTATVSLGLLLIFSIILLLIRPRQQTTGSPLRKKLWPGLVLLFVSFDLLLFALPLTPTLPATLYTQPMASAEFLRAQPAKGRFFVSDQFNDKIKFLQYFRFNTFGPLQTDHWQAFKETLVPNLGVYAHLPASNNDDPLTVGRWHRLVNLITWADPDQRARLLSVLNAAYFVDTPAQPVWPVIYEDEAIAIQTPPHGLPRAYFITEAIVVHSEAAVVEKLTSSDFDPRREVIIMETESGLTTDRQTNNPVDAIPAALIEQQANRVRLEVESPTTGFVVLTDTFYPGWQATLDGKAVEIQPANLAFRTVAVGAGKHIIEFSYRPRSFTTGLWISVITVLLVGIITIMRNMRKKH